MSSICIEPSGRTFEAASGETVLEAALRAGMNVPYNCNNGSCGQCAARLISGEIGKHLPHDYAFRQHEKDQGLFLMCSATPGSDMVIESRTIGSAEDVPHQEIDAKVYKVDEVADNVRVLQLRTPRSQTLRFLAGQYVTLHIDGLAPRSKSVASCPCNGMYLQFHVRYSQEDPFARYIFNNITPRSSMRIAGPHGSFTLDENSRRPMIFIANDTGIAPMKSLIEHCIALESSQPMHLYWLVKNRDEYYLANYVRSLEDALDNFVYTPIFQEDMSSEPPGFDETVEKLAEQIVMDYPVLEEYDVYMNGPADRYAALTERLVQHRLPQNRLFIDSLKHY
ncbi:2Fe-2S iron-sulfur cluster-binding protein [Thiohalophilus thiocyanatoxydans]|uniref:CDP-4-dehydro-6-deoxyglucose reductase n=1 Tax=Thiohalophilus thiocyanatoxydans TaxID=381308 RepID=A0A4R8IUH0_9GAMM|nr:2Fe-2S iron-sulfur cluster-binding protein [Thiohalophilus thiocyanatoxydans]TDY00943.1 CDP-4-dehydro-6-deoxyglucose reductase [Thiohalophilus thiocyanatoxydans]